MRIDYLVLADAVAAVGGKHYIHGGGWDTLFTRTFPFVHATLGVALRLRVPWNETGRPATFTLDVLDADGHTILPAPPGTIHGTLDMGRPPHLIAGDDQVIPLALSINNLRFTGPGLYVVICHLNGEAMARAPFRVTHAPATPPGQPQG